MQNPKIISIVSLLCLLCVAVGRTCYKDGPVDWNEFTFETIAAGLIALMNYAVFQHRRFKRGDKT